MRIGQVRKVIHTQVDRDARGRGAAFRHLILGGAICEEDCQQNAAWVVRFGRVLEWEQGI